MNPYKQFTLSRVHGDWSVLVGQSHRLSDSSFREEAFNFACAIARQARPMVEEIVLNLTKAKYRFTHPKRVFCPAKKNNLDWIVEFEQRGVFLPLSLRAWLSEVGTVCLMGNHPAWLKPTYVFDDMEATNDVWYADPLVVELDADDLEGQLEEWEDQVAEDGGECVGPLMIDISPDHINKANISGGLPYRIASSERCVDSILYYERSATTFVGYLRKSLIWSGFAGFEYIEVPDDISSSLRHLMFGI